MNVLIACEFSGVVRQAFRRRGHTAYSCDLEPAEDGSPFHLQCSALDVINAGWDLLIAHPPCTYLCNSGVRWLYERGTRTRIPARWDAMAEGAAFYLACLNARAPRVAVENPIMHGHARRLVGRGPDQIVQPWMFGHGETKATGLHLRGLPPLQPTQIVEGRVGRVHHESPGPERWKSRSRTYPGIADAMAEQWEIL